MDDTRMDDPTGSDQRISETQDALPGADDVTDAQRLETLSNTIKEGIHAIFDLYEQSVTWKIQQGDISQEGIINLKNQCLDSLDTPTPNVVIIGIIDAMANTLNIPENEMAFQSQRNILDKQLNQYKRMQKSAQNHLAD